jgi:hypothetical protein
VNPHLVLLAVAVAALVVAIAALAVAVAVWRRTRPAVALMHGHRRQAGQDTPQQPAQEPATDPAPSSRHRAPGGQTRARRRDVDDPQWQTNADEPDAYDPVTTEFAALPDGPPRLPPPGAIRR